MSTSHSSSLPILPSYESVAEQLKPLLDIIQEAVEEGTIHVPEYTKWQAEAIDFALAPNLVRHKAKQFLLARGKEVNDDEEAMEGRFKTEHIPNNGLCMSMPGYTVKILKSADDGGIPLPGTSTTRQNYYNQYQAVLNFEEFRNGNEHAQPTWGLIVHWTVDKKYNLSRMSLALPLRFFRNENGKWMVECAFDEPFWTRGQSRAIPINEVLPPSDLNIHLEEEPGEQTGEEPN